MAGGVVMVRASRTSSGRRRWSPPPRSPRWSRMLWLLRGGVAGYVMNATAAVFTLVYVPFLGAFVALLLARGRRGALGDRHLHPGHDRLRHRRVRRRGARRQAPDGAGHLARRSRGRASPARRVSCVAGRLADRRLPARRRLVGRRRCSGLIAVVMATLGDLCESVIKRDLGIKDMSQIIPGHGGLMDRLDSLLATSPRSGCCCTTWSSRAGPGRPGSAGDTRPD